MFLFLLGNFLPTGSGRIVCPIDESLFVLTPLASRPCVCSTPISPNIRF